MITDRQKNLLLQQYSDRGLLKKEIRSYEVSLWTLQDSFITVLKWSDIEQKGRIEEPQMMLNIDGTQEFTFSIPMYFNFHGQMIENPNWYTTRNGNIMASMRKVKVIFNKATENEQVFEFIIVDVKELHEKDMAKCELKCEGLAFHELGKIGYMYSLSQEVFELDYEKWQKTGIGNEPLETVQYWMSKINIPVLPTNSALVDGATWYYKIDMVYSAFSESGPARDSSKVYEESYTSAWTADLKPKMTKNYQEKARPIKIENSNIYNITQEIAKKFNIFCRYEFEYDENYHIKQRCIIFYNTYLEEEKGLMTFMYPHSSSSIKREMDASNLTTKLFVSDVSDNTIYSGYHSIMNVEANRTREKYILNFDYMRDIGTITEEQYNSITPYEIKMRSLNEQIMQLQDNLAAYQEQIPEIRAKIAVLSSSIDTATEQITQNNRLKNALDLNDGDADGFISVTSFNPDQRVIITNGTGSFIRIDDTNKGIDTGTIQIFRSYNSSNQTLSNEITGFVPQYEEEFNTLVRIDVPAQTGSQIVYLTYKYNPIMYYEQIIKIWQTKMGKDSDELAKQKEKLGEKNEQTDRGISGLYKIVTDTEDRIEELLIQKQNEIKAFERIMGPAMREGYWSPEDYNDYGEQKVAVETLTMSNPAIIMTEGTGTGMKVGWEMDLFDGEQDIYYKYGITETKTFYPVINLTSIYSELQGQAEEFSFIFNNNYYDNTANINDIKNLQVYKIGASALIRFVRQENSIYPALIIVGAKTLSDDQLNFMFDPGKGHPRIAKISTSINESTGVVSTIITDAIDVSDDHFWKFNGQAISTCNVVYPRVKFSSLALRTDTTNLLLRYNDILLSQYEDYRINTRTVERDGNYYPEYFITLKPEVIFQQGFNLQVQANYILSNADVSIYLDALEVSKENAYPKASYEITPTILDPNLSSTLYSKLAQVVMINDVELKFENTFGYISEIKLDLDNVTKDSVTIKNYKTKFEDLFSTIVAQTESMKHAESALSAAAVGGVALNQSAFSATLQNNATILSAFIDAHFDSSQVVLDKLTALFTEAGQILAASSDTLNAMHSLTIDNASILGNFAEDVASELTPHVYRQQEKPTSFKFGDIWIQTDTNGEEVGRYMATSNGTAHDDTTAGFVRTWDGTLAQIYGASLNVDADQGIIDVIARNYLNLRAGNVYIAANHRVDIVGNESVNIGGAELNFCSLYEEDEDGTQGNLVETKGINLIAGMYSQKDTAGISKILITPVRLEFASSEMLMKAASSITLLASTGAGAGTAAVSIDANKGLWLGAGAGVHIYSGTAADRIFVGPKHKAKFQMGDIWVRINKISNAGHNSYDGDPAITDATQRQYYTNYIQSGNDYSTYFTIEGKYVANSSWDEIYESEADANEGMNSTTGWTKNNAVLDNDDILNAKGASVEMSEDHILFGYSNVQKNASNSTAIEMTDEYVLIAAGDNFQTMQNRSVTGMSNSLIGAKFTKDSIGMAVGSGNNITAMVMNYNGLTFGNGLGSVNIGTASNSALRSGVQSSGGSYVRISHSGIELGSTSELYINTNNFKLQTYSLDPQNTSYVMGDTILAIGNKLNDITSATTPAQIMNMDGKNGVDVRLVVNSTGLYIKGDVYAENGSFTGDVVARTLYANGGLTAQGTGFVFAVDGNYLGMFRITAANGKISDSSTQKLLYFDSAKNTLFLTGTLDVANIKISEDDVSATWEDYFSNLDISYMSTVDAKIKELFDTAGLAIQAAIKSAKDVTALNAINEARLAGFKTAVADGLRPEEVTGAQHMAKFKKGDVWNRTGSAGAAKFMATQNWDEVYASEALASVASALTSTDGWNRISGGAIADIRGANLIVDAEAGSMALKAANTITLQTNTGGAYTTSINLNSNNIELTASANQTTGQGGTLKLSGETSVSIASGGGIYFVTSNTYDGTKAISIDKNGIDLASSSNIELRAGGSINIYSGSEQSASAFRLNKDEGIWVGTDQKIDFAANANGSGSALRLTKNRILLGVTTSSNTGAVDITPEQVILGVANAATGMENMDITLDGTASGVRITRNVIQLATGSSNRRSLISMSPERVFIGTASQSVVQTAASLSALKLDMQSGTAQNKGAYIDILNEASTSYPIFEIGSTAQFTILTPKFFVDNLATGNNLMFYISDTNSNSWGDAAMGIKFSPGTGLEIHATELRIAANSLKFVSAVFGKTDLAAAFDALDTDITQIEDGTTAVPHVSNTGFSITDTTFNMNSTGTMWLHGNNGLYITTNDSHTTNSVILNSNGIELKSGAAFVVESNFFNINTSGYMTCTGGHIGGWIIGDSSLENDTSTDGNNAAANHVELRSKGSYFVFAGANSASDAKFKVKKNGDVYMNSLMIYDPNHTIGTGAGVYEGDYIRINFSGTNFPDAISLNGGGSWNGYTFTATLTCWGKISKNLSMTAKVKLLDAQYLGFNASTFRATFKVNVERSVNGSAVAEELSWDSGIDVTVPVNYGWMKAADAVKYTSKAKSLTVPTGNTFDSTGSLDITPTWNDGYLNGEAKTLENTTNTATATTLSIKVTSEDGNSILYRDCDVSTYHSNVLTKGYNDAHLVTTIEGSAVVVSKAKSGGTSGATASSSTTITASISYNSTSHTYTATATGMRQTLDSKDSGTEGYDAGYKKGWNDCVDKMKTLTVSDAYKTNGTTTVPYSGDAACSEGHSIRYSGNVTITAYTTYSDIYRAPDKKT